MPFLTHRAIIGPMKKTALIALFLIHTATALAATANKYQKEVSSIENTLTQTFYPTLAKWFAGPWKKRLEITIDPQLNHRDAQVRNGEKSYQLVVHPRIFHLDNRQQLLAHELGHLMLWEFSEVAQPPWFQEGFAELISTLLTKKLQAYQVFSSLDSATSRFMEAYEQEEQRDHKLYGHHFLYFKYLYDQCGGDGFLKTLLQMTANDSGILAIEHSLKEIKNNSSPCRSFVTSYIGYSIARVLNRKVAQSPFFQILPGSTAQTTPMGHLPDLDSFHLLDSVYLNAQTFHQAKQTIPPKFSSFWIHPSPPYQVRETPPQENGDWAVLLIKLNH